MKEPEIIKKLEDEFFEHLETPAWDRCASALRKAYNLPDKEMTFADAVIVLNVWDRLQETDKVTKKEIDDFVKAMFIVHGGRK